jgi:hypothetical protein
LTLDAAGFAHIGYGDTELRYCFQDASGWHIQILEGAPIIPGSTSLVLDRHGYPHFSYTADIGDSGVSIKYTFQDANSWHTQTVQKEWGRWTTSLALDSANQPHITFVGIGFRYVTRVSGGWQSQVIESIGSVGHYNALALDADDQPHISYSADWPHFDLKYAHAEVEKFRYILLPIVIKSR